jgi:hypothetical protein
MHPLSWLLAVSLLLQVRLPENAVEVVSEGERISVKADRLPLSQLLDRIARKTGMTVTYEGTRPSMLVSLDVERVSEVEAVLKVMEGLGISYVLKTDATGEGVDLLIVSGAGAGTLVAANQPAGHVESPPEEVVPAYNYVPLDPAVVEAAGGDAPPNLKNPYMGLPAQHFPQAMAPQPSEIAGPELPQAASYPSSR